jgi:hypothetical protein
VYSTFSDLPYLRAVKGGICSLGRSGEWPVDCGKCRNDLACSNYTNITSNRIHSNPCLWSPIQSFMKRWLFLDCGSRMCFDPEAESIDINDTYTAGNSSLFDQFKDEPSFYSLSLVAEFKKTSKDRPHVNAQVHITLEKNSEYKSEGDIVSTYHVEVYRGDSHQQRMELRYFFTILVLFEILRHKKSSEKITFYDFRPLIIFLWLSAVSFSPKHTLGYWTKVNEAVTCSTYLVMTVTSFCLTAILSPARTQKFGLAFCSAFVIISIVLVGWAIESFSSPFLFPKDNTSSVSIFRLLWGLLAMNSIVNAGLVKLEMQRELKPFTKTLTVCSAHFVLLVLWYCFFRPDGFDADCNFQAFNLVRFMFVRFMEVRARSLLLLLTAFRTYSFAGARSSSSSHETAAVAAAPAPQSRRKLRFDCFERQFCETRGVHRLCVCSMSSAAFRRSSPTSAVLEAPKPKRIYQSRCRPANVSHGALGVSRPQEVGETSAISCVLSQRRGFH